jgi:hypothetical protein
VNHLYLPRSGTTNTVESHTKIFENYKIIAKHSKIAGKTREINPVESHTKIFENYKIIAKHCKIAGKTKEIKNTFIQCNFLTV